MENGISVAHSNEDKISHARDKGKPHGGEFRLEIFASLIGEFTCAAHMGFIGQTSECAGLSDAIGIERLAGFLENFGDFCRGNSVSDAKVGQALDF